MDGDGAIPTLPAWFYNVQFQLNEISNHQQR